MQTVSPEWINEFNSNYMMDEQYVDVTIDLTDPGVFADAEVTASGGQLSYSDVSGIVGDETPVKYGNLETNLWLLDNTVDWQDGNGYAGFISAVMSNDQRLVSNVSITIDIGESTTTSGITIEWSTVYGEYATDFTVIYYDENNEVVHSEMITNNSDAISYIGSEVEDYLRIRIEINKWCLPGRHPRVEHVVAGRRFLFTKHELQSLSMKSSISMVSAELPYGQLDITIDNSSGKYSGANFESYLKRMQKCTVRCGITINGKPNYVNGGTFWLDTWDFPNGGISPKMSFRDALYFMQEKYIYGLYRENGITMLALATEVLEKAKTLVPVITSYNLIGSMAAYSTVAPLPVCTFAECLQYIAQACGMVISIGRDGVISIGFIPDAGSATVDEKNLLQFPQTSLKQELKRIDCNVTSYQYSQYESDSDKYPNVNGGQGVTASDVQTILTAAVNTGAGEPTGLTPEQEEKADADRDGMITAMDAALVQEYITACGAGEYVDDPNGWALFLNIETGLKPKIYEGYHNIVGTQTIVITHSPSAEVNVMLEGSNSRIVSINDYTCATSVTIEANGTVLVKAYGFPIESSTHDYMNSNSQSGEIEYVSNPLITSNNLAYISTEAAKDWLNNRVGYEVGEMRFDPRIEPGDKVTIGNNTVVVEETEIRFTGMFRGKIVGRLER